MFDQVAKEVIKAGLCANDTTIITKSDTTIKVDTLTIVDEQLEVKVFNDTTYITKWKTRVVKESLTIHDTIKRYIVDNARVNILQAELTSAKVEADNWRGKANKAFGCCPWYRQPPSASGRAQTPHPRCTNARGSRGAPSRTE